MGLLKAASKSNSYLFSRHTIKLVHRAHEIFPVHSNIRVCVVLLDAARKYPLLAQFRVSLTLYSPKLPPAASKISIISGWQEGCCVVSTGCRSDSCCTILKKNKQQTPHLWTRIKPNLVLRVGLRGRGGEGWQGPGWQDSWNLLDYMVEEWPCVCIFKFHRSSWNGVEWHACSVVSDCGPVGCSPPGSSVHGISQARILARVAISFSRGSSWPCISCIGRQILYHFAMKWGRKSNWVWMQENVSLP